MKTHQHRCPVFLNSHSLTCVRHAPLFGRSLRETGKLLPSTHAHTRAPKTQKMSYKNQQPYPQRSMGGTGAGVSYAGHPGGSSPYVPGVLRNQWNTEISRGTISNWTGMNRASFGNMRDVGGNQSYTANHLSEPRIVIRATVYGDPNAKNAITIQDQDFIWYKRVTVGDIKKLRDHQTENSLHSEQSSSNTNQTPRRAWNLAEVNAELLKDQVNYMVQHNAELYASAEQCYYESKFFCVGLAHAIQTATGFGSLQMLASMLGPAINPGNRPDRSLIVDLCLKGHATTFNYFNRLLLAGGSLGFVLAKVAVHSSKYPVQAGMRMDYGTHQGRLNYQAPQVAPFPNHFGVTAPLSAPAVAGAPPLLEVYQWLPAGAFASKHRIPEKIAYQAHIPSGTPMPPVYLPDRGGFVYQRVADLRHGYMDDNVLIGEDTPIDTYVDVATNYNMQRRGKPIEIIVNISQPTFFKS